VVCLKSTSTFLRPSSRGAIASDRPYRIAPIDDAVALNRGGLDRRFMVSFVHRNRKEGRLATTTASDELTAAHAGRPPARFRLWKRTATVVLIGAISVSWTFRRPWFEGNLGVVDSGLVIRSAQPTTQLSDWARRYRLKSVVNLRGGGAGDWWYGNEIKCARESGVAYYDLPLSATRRPTRCELLQLIDLLDRCSYPLLIHCKSGADRTGLASALYRMVRRAEPPESALSSFSIEFGHIPLFGTEHLHEPLQEYAAWLKSAGLAHSADRFRTWVRNEYAAPDAPADPPLIHPGPRARRS
jgi:protein tyrosine phosphatase (PTP) superfamily phosphohydrolase (DUF442 family)